MTTELEEFTAFAGRLAEAARAEIVPHFRANVSIDDKPADSEMGQPVTIADLASETAIRDLIMERYPDHGIIGEEHGNHNEDADYVWVLDPIDGTRAFISGLPMFGTLIGLMHQRRPIVGVIDQPVMHECYIGSSLGTFCNGRPVRCRPCGDVARAVYATTDHRMYRTDARRTVFERLNRDSQFTQFGGNCYAFAMLAIGAVDLATEANVKLWDVAALVPVVEGAGGVITAWDGGPAVDSDAIVACGDPRLHEQLLPMLKSAG